jgi:hypothetical protein
MTSWHRTLFSMAAAAVIVVSAAPAQAQTQARDEYGEIRQTVARISWIDGSASFARGDDPDNWQPADRNIPMTLGDRVYTGSRSRLELEVHGGDVVRIGAETDLAALNLTDDTRQFSLTSGVGSFDVRNLGEDEVFEVDTPNAAITFDRDGRYRIDVDPDGNTTVAVLQGSAVVAAGGGQIPVRAGEGLQIWGTDQPEYDRIALRRPDAWDRWVESREARMSRSRSYQYVSASIVGADDLDESGRWEDVPEYGHCWTPTVVAADWVPYRIGHWVWQDPWGWTWISAEPWGWAPYHYGRWVTWQSRWFWVPVERRVARVAYSPALVAFVGGGPGWSASFTAGGGGFVGWFPLGPRDPFNPWWGARRAYDSRATNFRYVNRTYVTVVNQNTFVTGAPVTTSFVRDRAVVSQVISAPVARGPIPVVPTRESLRFAARTTLSASPRPSQAIVARAVVARVAPPPAPPAFSQKVEVIRENRGAPVAPAAAARMSVQERGTPRTITRVMPAAPEPGRVQLQPRNRDAAAARVEPIAPLRGRPLATSQQPVAPMPVTSGSAAPGRQVPERAVPERVVPERGRPPNSQVQTAPTAAPQPGRPVLQEQNPTRPADQDWRNRQRIERAPVPTAAPQGQPQVERGRFERAMPAPTAAPQGQPQVERGRPERAIAAPTAAPQRQPQVERGRFERAMPAPTAAPQGQPQVERGRPERQRVESAPAATAAPRPERQRIENAPAPPAERGQPRAVPQGQPPAQNAAPPDRSRQGGQGQEKKPTPKKDDKNKDKEKDKDNDKQ